MDLDKLRTTFSGRLLTDAVDMAPYLTDWRRKWTGKALAVAQPDSPADVRAVVRWCQTHGVPLVPQGGNTGLSGGATPDESGRALLLSLTRLSRIRGIDTVNNTIEVEAGATLQQVQTAARAAGRLFPLSLAAEGSCTIGGNLACNAGGVQVLRYGTARDLCLGLEVVTPTGELWEGMTGLRKNNTGYSLRDIFIGSEGTLGVITAATLKLFHLPASEQVAFAAVSSPAAAVALLVYAQEQLGTALTAFELMSNACMQLVEQHLETARVPLRARAPWYVLIEIAYSRADGDAKATTNDDKADTAFETLMMHAMEQAWVSDVVVSQNLTQFEALWALRENISEAQGAHGACIKHDIALPISAIARFIESTDAVLSALFPNIKLVVFGHVGDGNLHYNVSLTQALSETELIVLETTINRVVHDAVMTFSGSISAEHGLGVLRRDESARYKSAIEMQMMHAIKRALDPQNLMNPGKLLLEMKEDCK